MATDLSEKDHALLDQYLNKVLDRYKNGQLSQLEARSDLAHAFTMISLDDGNFRSYMRASIDGIGEE